MLLLNPATYDPTFLADDDRAALRDLVAFFEGKGLAEMKAEYHAGTWYKDFLDLVATRRLFARVATPAAVGALIGDDGRPVGHRPDQRAQRDPRLLLPGPLVRLAGQRARPGPGVDQRQRGRQAAGRRAAARRRHLRLRPVRAHARGGHLLDRHDPDPVRGRTAGSPTAASTTSATATRRPGSASSASSPTTTPSTPASTSSSWPTRSTRLRAGAEHGAGQMYVSEFVLHDYPVTAATCCTSASPRGTPPWPR
jgi:hypothetical protein